MVYFFVNKINCDRGNVIYLFISYGFNIDINLFGILLVLFLDNGILLKLMCFKGSCLLCFFIL